MSSKFLHKFISEMHIKLNELIENCNYDLTNDEVLKFSQKLDRIILIYNTVKERDRKANA